MSATTGGARRFRVLHTSRSLRVDGVVKVVLRNVSHLDTSGFEHVVCSLLPGDQLAGEFRAQGIEPIFIGHRGPRSAPATVARLVRLIRERGIDLVHVHRTLDLLLAGTAARLCGVPVVSTIHWIGPEPYPEEVPAWRKRARGMVRVVLDRLLADRVIVVSGAVRDSYASLPGFPLARTEVVYPGVDMGPAAPPDPAAAERLRGALGLAGRGPILLNVGRLHPVKGQRHLLPMMRRVRERLPHAVLLIAGGGELHDHLSAAIAAEGLGDAVRLLGSRSDVDDLLAISDLLVLSSESEAAPLPPMEAMRQGKPVVATRAGGVAEIVQTGISGYVVPRGDAEALAAAVLRVLGTPGEAVRLGEAGRRIAAERFDIAHSVRELERIYRALLQTRTGRPRGVPDAPSSSALSAGSRYA